MPTTPVSPSLVARMRDLWNAGKTSGEIAEITGRSRNAVLGIAHRHDFAARPSPIRREKAPKPEAPAPRRMPSPSPAPLASAVAAAPPPPQPKAWSPVIGCRWPLWADEAKPDQHYCGAPCQAWPRSGERRPATYCGKHLRRAIARTTEPHASVGL